MDVGPFDRLPDELVLMVLRASGDGRAVAAWSATSQRHRRIGRDPALWRALCEATCGPVRRTRFLDAGKDWIWLWRALHCRQTGKGVRTCRTLTMRKTYYGDTLDGEPHGYALRVWTGLGGTRRSLFAHDEARDGIEPPDAATTPMRDYYEGEYHRGEIHGRGLWVYDTGSWYDGEWIDGDRHGFGVYGGRGGDRYVGAWEGAPHGYGVTTWPNGDTYAGEHAHDKRHGWGVMHTDGAVYEGQWRVDDYCGFGTLVDADGRSYRGEWIDGKLDGWGMCAWDDGQHHVGYWRDGRAHGYGRREVPDGHSIEGVWVNGRLEGHAVVTQGGRRYEGACDAKGASCGFGILTYADGSRLAGVWSAAACGQGQVIGHGDRESCGPASPCDACVAHAVFLA